MSIHLQCTTEDCVGVTLVLSTQLSSYVTLRRFITLFKKEEIPNNYDGFFME